MEYNAFSEGIDPGGLRNTRDIGILICYLLDTIQTPFSKKDLIEIIQENGLANYFETTAAVSELIKNKNVTEENEMLTISPNGVLISHLLHTNLSLSVRQKAVAATMKLVERKKLEEENPVRITKAEGGGYHVTMRITDGMRDLMSLTLFVPDKREASAVVRKFYEDPQRLYSILLASVVGNQELVREALEGLQHE